MSNPESAPARRPAVVLSAASVLVVMAVGALAYAVVDLVVLGGTVDAFRSAARDTSASPEQIDDVVTLLRASAVLSAVVAALSAPVLAGLALGLRARRNGARVATWVVSGLGLLGGCCSVAVLVGERAAPLQLGADEQSLAELLGLIGDAYPSWWIPLNAGLSVGQGLGYLVVATLLALPAANAWFGHRRSTAPTMPSAPPAFTPAPHQPPPAPPAPPYPPR
ncbi:hypothetical protein [Micromonospora parathelypteridis]|uniref:Uncharacterized protein n=1 Tax=Micromonospora parathelypteridis TaxID=1839617 RepID=A0A840VN64_9ACTN|nr:hypothetical protein [Micromonospora parathelypteridis]MBB5478432.1 hypothetical protein [Micromonospora parathelypteridis]GGO06284.1 hypothetical protein GCM10011576_09790 [Micromonospora parathelypteridis]